LKGFALRYQCTFWYQYGKLHIFCYRASAYECISEEVVSLQCRRASTDATLLTTVEETRATVKDYLKVVSTSDQEWKQDMVAAVNRAYTLKDHEAGSRAPAVDMKSGYKAEDVEEFTRRLLLQLRFREMDYRYEAIAKAYEATFEWIFHTPENSLWSDFITWLEGDDFLYWITGKPAAGKSTLMKFIFRDRRTKQFLESWAAGKELLISSYYFWHAGSEIQMSQEGFARSLLHSCLEQAPDLIPSVFPHRMETYVLFGDRFAWSTPWSWQELITAFKTLVEEAGKTRKIFFFIDGLDEFNGNHNELVELVQNLLSSSVKICVSSRPWNVFEDGFRQRPSLRVEDLTMHDIEHFVRSRFLASYGFVELQTLDPDFANQLIENITQKSQGVFLWVALVTDSLVEGLSDGERLDDLQRRLDALPADLESLFSKVLDSLNPVQKRRIGPIVQIIRASQDPMTLLMFSFADEEDPLLATKVSIGPLAAHVANARAQIMRRRINGCCKGLIEVTRGVLADLPGAQVGYLHRSVKDFFDRPDILSGFFSTADKSFNPNLRLCNAYIVMFKIDSTSPSFADESSADIFWRQVERVIGYAAKAEETGAGPQITLLNEFDQVVTKKCEASALSKWPHNFVLPVLHWSATRIGCDANRSFLHLAVQVQLMSYVEHNLSEPLDPLVEKTLASLLLVAVDRFDCIRPEGTGHKILSPVEPNLGLIKLLLKRGADPRERLALNFWKTGVSGISSPYEVAAMRKASHPWIRDVLHQHNKALSKLEKSKKWDKRISRLTDLLGGS
jgi:hypothetical protein